MVFTITKKFILAKVEEKKKSNLYHILDTETHAKSVVIGIKTDEEIKELTIVEADIDVRIQKEKFDLITGEKKYKDTATLFLTSIRSVGE